MQPYSLKEIATLKELAGKKTPTEIATILGRSKFSVKSYASSHNISLRLTGENHHSSKLSNLQREMILALDVAGFTSSEIQKAMLNHVTRHCIDNVLITFTK